MKSAEAGQSSVELAVAVTAFVLLGLGVVMLAHLQGIQSQAIVASRRVAFDAAWGQGRQQAEARDLQLHEALFSDQGWRDPTGRSRLLVGAAAIRSEIAESSPPGRLPEVNRVLLAPLQLGGFFSTGFDLTEQGFQRVAVHVDVDAAAHLPAPLNGFGMALTERMALLTDAWSASGPRHVARRTEALMPTTLLGQQDQLLRPFNALLTIIEPSLTRLCLGIVEPDRLPADRLSQNGVARAPVPRDACR